MAQQWHRQRGITSYYVCRHDRPRPSTCLLKPYDACILLIHVSCDAALSPVGGYRSNEFGVSLHELISLPPPMLLPAGLFPCNSHTGRPTAVFELRRPGHMGSSDSSPRGRHLSTQRSACHRTRRRRAESVLPSDATTSSQTCPYPLPCTSHHDMVLRVTLYGAQRPRANPPRSTWPQSRHCFSQKAFNAQ